MRIDDLIMYLGNDFVIDSKEEQGKTIISVYTKDSYHIDLDTRLELVNLGDSSIWTLFQVQRDQFFQLSQFQRKDTAMLALYISVKGKFEQLALDNSVKEKLRSMSNDTEQLQNILEANVESKYFSLIDTKMGAINLYKTGEKYDVVYLNPMKEKIWISKERKLPHAVVIVYNFSSKLQEFDKLIESVDIEKALSAIEIESLKRIYIGK
ncbi:hypothetical protein D0U04_24870 [Bacillus clarus]|uniref:Uncharacterized protein n=1 Tax=Bacillus clarus TaxID=2338372 RepID=A0A090YB49_9BACI|nr:hypothetical protein [Bacillus clarus]KFM95704.1 hypothetical protein DJ93_5475 [Bacillus clarus]RFT63507.1 hypothetical protein D0U04_24870 [Bacillus clarus]